MSKFYITTSIPYVNGKAHIGHALEFTQADVLARYHRMQGDETVFLTGADEHGSKNYKKAKEENKAPQEFVDEITASFQKAHQALNISYDRFVKTSSEEHKLSAQAVWAKLLAGEDIYRAEYEGLYCVGCESFVSEKEARVNNGVCPIHKQPYEQLKEENYFFRLSKYTEPVKKAIEEDSFKILPESRKHEILSLLNEGLEDISISRPKELLPWGVPVPNDETQIMYVWFEALINYISGLGYPDHPDFAKLWPADVQIIGKDILRFHAAIWPAMLIGIGVDLPKTLLVHGFISSGGQKMSKSLGNVIDPMVVIDQYGVDALRYYLMRHIPATEDGDFTFEKFELTYNGELADDLGNLVQRIATMVNRYQGGVIGDIPDPEHDVAEYRESMDRLEFGKALEAAWRQVRGLNQYLEMEKPWEIAKEDADHLNEVLSYSVGSLLEITILIKPFLPATAEKIEALFASGKVSGDMPVLFPKQHHYSKQ